MVRTRQPWAEFKHGRRFNFFQFPKRISFHDAPRWSSDTGIPIQTYYDIHPDFAKYQKRAADRKGTYQRQIKEGRTLTNLWTYKSLLKYLPKGKSLKETLKNPELYQQFQQNIPHYTRKEIPNLPVKQWPFNVHKQKELQQSHPNEPIWKVPHSWSKPEGAQLLQLHQNPRGYGKYLLQSQKKPTVEKPLYQEAPYTREDYLREHTKPVVPERSVMDRGKAFTNTPVIPIKSAFRTPKERALASLLPAWHMSKKNSKLAVSRRMVHPFGNKYRDFYHPKQHK